MFAIPSLAQDRDTTETKVRLHPEKSSFKLKGHHERMISNLPMPSSGVYGKPQPTQYYQPPFSGQSHLDKAVEAYREEQKDKIGPSWLFKFLNILSPYVNNQFEFGVYKIEDLPIVERDNPYFQSDQ